MEFLRTAVRKRRCQAVVGTVCRVCTEVSPYGGIEKVQHKIRKPRRVVQARSHPALDGGWSLLHKFRPPQNSCHPRESGGPAPASDKSSRAPERHFEQLRELGSRLRGNDSF